MKNQLPLYEQIHEFEAVTHTHSAPATKQPLPPQPSGDYQLTTCPAYVSNTAPSGGAEVDGECALSGDEVSGVAEVEGNEEQYEEITGDEVTFAKGDDKEQYEAVSTDGAA